MAAYDFFLSFFGFDLKLATAIHRILCAAKYRVWFYPVDSPTGGCFPDEISRGLNESAKVFVVLTPRYVDSPLTRAEFFHGWEKGKLLILRFGEATLPPLAEVLTYQQCEYEPDEDGFAEVVLSTARGRPLAPRQDVKHIDFRLLEPRTTGTAFVGRRDELDRIDDAFEDKKCAVVCVIARGGFGKTTLVKAWIDGRDNPVRHRVSAGYAWSFTCQGVNNVSPSSDKFFEATLKHLLPSGTPIEASSEGRSKQLLQNLGAQRRALLVLDGLEPLQNRADEVSPGQINDKTLERFIGALVFDSGSTTTIITSRVMPANLVQYLESGRVRVVTPDAPPPVVAIELGRLDRQASIQLLQKARRNYAAPASPVLDDVTLDAIANECEDNPLLLSLVGPAVASGNYGLEDLRRHRDPGEAGESVGFEEKLCDVLESQLNVLGPEARALLYSVCVFSDPVLGHELERRLLRRAKIPVITSPLLEATPFYRRRRVSPRLLRKAADKLERAAILVLDKKGANGEDALDALDWTYGVQPVIQTYIRTILVRNLKSEWKKANATVYLALVHSVKLVHLSRKAQPTEKEEARRLYSAIPHGIQAGWGRRVGWMYGLRCQRGYRAYSTNHLGMIGEDVEAMSHYFHGRWAYVRTDIGLGPSDEGLAYSWAGLVLIGTNQLNHGVQLMQRGMRIAEAAGAFITAARAARHLAFITALLGKKEESLELARHALRLTSRRRPLARWLIDWPLISMPYQRMTARANLGCVLHYFGQYEEAEAEFRKAEQIQAREHGRYPKLRAIWGYRYADLLLDLGRFKEADERFLAGLVDPDSPKGWGEGVFAAPLMKLGFVRSNVRQADLNGEKRSWDKVVEFYDELKKFGKAEEQDAGLAAALDAGEKNTRPVKKAKKEYKNNRLDILLPAFRSGTAGVARLLGEYDEALRQVEDAERAAQDAGTVLFDAEIAMERARIHLARGEREAAFASLSKVLARPSEVNYRRGELERLLAQTEKGASAVPSI